MALLGKGLLAIWNGISDQADAEFVKWHIQEHIPERVGLPGFLRGRRYVAHEGHPKYFNFYETESVATLESPAYKERLNAPSPWTQRVVKEFKDTSRTLCDVVVSLGRGEGAWIETIQIAGDNSLAAQLTGHCAEIAKLDGVVGVHLLRGVEAKPSGPTVENKLRGQPDARCDWILLIEAAELEFIQAARGGEASNRSLAAKTGDAKTVRGIYRLQYGLTHSELQR